MRPDNTRMSSPTRSRRGLALLIAMGAALGFTLLAAVPAHANDTTKQVASNGQSVVFSTSDSSRKVSGSVAFTVNQDGNWKIAAGARNGNLLGRWYRWTCDLTWDAASVTHATGKEWVPGKKSRSITAQAYDPHIQANFATIVDRGRADCDIVVG
ncbi:MAG: hypothetical protein HKP61_15295 [Dactylosporangium sp.]|nr:hypothetical protein [Dactylosporangium sp.]NNJ62273.1 hypothetical protein [Dactylosporangium sp.]